MEVVSLILVVVFILLAMLLFKLIHKIVSFLVTLLILGVILLGFLTYLDFRAIENNQFQTLLLFTNNGKVTFAAQLTGFDFSTARELPKAERIRLEVMLNNSNLQGALADNTKLVVVSEDVYKKGYAELTESFKGNTLEQIDLGIKEGGLYVYPETLYFRFVRLVPKSLVTKIA